MSEPPSTTNHEGHERRIGVEIEFSACSAQDGAGVIKRLFGGEISQIDPHRVEVANTDLGTFLVELDFHFAHPDTSDPQTNGSVDSILGEFREKLSAALGDLSALVVPCEVVCPPVSLARFQELEALPEALRNAGAHGTETNVLYAFGLHLNPEVADTSSQYLASILKAYLLLSDWLRSSIEVDVTRRILSFVDPFPNDYVSLIVDSNYWPSIDQLIDDYLAYNPTRNRELDMLPLCAWLNENRVKEAIRDERVKKRPTFHFRLPNSNLNDPNWSLTEEWNRWCVVENLAADRDKLQQMQDAYLVINRSQNPASWYDEVKKWMT